MSSKPSRSEIESALSGSQKRLKTNKANIAVSHGPLSRRQQTVLGGDLTGISKPKRLNINYINWVLSGVVVLILVAFFIPTQPNDSVNEIPQDPEQTVNSKPFYTQSRIDDKAESQTSFESFTRDNDVDRADIYRDQEQQEAQINRLLAEAEVFIKKGTYTQPATNNAYQRYLDILELDSSNRKAKQGISYIKKRFLSAGLSAIKDEKEKAAVDALSKLASIDRESDEYTELDDTLSSWQKDKKIQTLLGNARKAFAEKNLILPASESALYYYQQVLKVDPEQSNANKGIRQIADTFVSKANQAILEGEYEAATGYLTTVSVIKPEHESIDLIREMITNAKAIAAERQANVEKEIALSMAEPGNTVELDTVTPSSNAKDESVKETLSQTSSSQKTPAKQSEEQQLFDKEYLTKGLAAYYQGNYETANALLQPLADKGISRAQFRIGYMHFLGRGMSKNKLEADRVIRAALPAVLKFAKEGRAWAQSDIGSLYEDGLVLPKDYAEAVYWYRRAAEQGYPGAQTNLGIMYAYGRGVTASRKTAIEWFQRAAKQGDVAAIRNLESLGIKI